MIKDLRVGTCRGGCLLLFSFGLLLTPTGCSQGPAPADPSSSNADQWVRFLSTGDPPHRIEAVTGLGKLRKPEYVENILKVAVTDRQVPVRVAAILALGQPGLLNDNEVRAVTLLLSASDSEVRMAACRAVGAINAPDAAESLMRAMHDRDSSVRLTAVESLGKLGPSVIPMFATIFEKGSPDQKTMIASVAGKKKDPLYIGLLTTGLKDDDDGVRRTCAEALGVMGQTSAIPSLVSIVTDPLSPARIEEFRQRIHQRPYESDYAIMIKLLDEDCIRQRIRPDRDKYPWIRNGIHTNIYSRALLVQQREAAKFVRVAAIQAITNIAPSNLDSILIDLLAHTDEDVGSVASESLRDRGDKARALLVKAAQDPKLSPLARSRAVDILAPAVALTKVNQSDKLRTILLDKSENETGVEEEQVEAPAIVELPADVRQLFVSLLSDPESLLRASVAVHLGRAGAKEAIEPLLEAFRKADPAQMDKVTLALASFKDDRITPVLVAALNDGRYAASHGTIIKALGAIGDKKATPALLRVATERDDVGLQGQAIESLGQINDPSAVGPMVEWLNKLHQSMKDLALTPPDKDPKENERRRGRSWVMDQLERKLILFFGTVKARDAVQPLITILNDTNRNVAVDTMVALGRIGDARAVGPISDYIRKGGSYHSRLYVNHTTKAGIDALVAIRDPGGIEVLKKFAADWQNPKDPFTGKYAIEAIGRMRHPEGVAVLIRYLTDPEIDPGMQDGCVGPALAAAGVVAREPLLKLLTESPKPKEGAKTDPGMYAAQILAVMDKPEVNVVPDLVRILATKPPSHILQRVTESLAQTHSEAAVRALAETMKSQDVAARRLAALALGKAKLRSVVPHLQAALNDEDGKVKECAAASLIEVLLEKPDVNTIPDIVRILATRPPNIIVMRVVETLGQIRQDVAVQALADVMKFPEAPVREFAVATMGKTKLHSAIPHLQAALRDEDAKVRESAGNALLDVLLEKPDAANIPYLVGAAATKPSPVVAQRITEALAQMHSEAAVQALADIVKAADAPTRELAVVALGKVKLRSAIPHLKAAQQDADAKVRESAGLALLEYGVGAKPVKKE